MPNGDDIIEVECVSGFLPEANDNPDTQMIRVLVIPDEVVLALGNTERNKNPDEAFFLF